ncbi:MAG: hypothetical protein QME81_06310 [bacterium]|nr:hypothetical protein [bacterium]
MDSIPTGPSRPGGPNAEQGRNPQSEIHIPKSIKWGKDYEKNKHDWPYYHLHSTYEQIGFGPGDASQSLTGG